MWLHNCLIPNTRQHSIHAARTSKNSRNGKIPAADRLDLAVRNRPIYGLNKEGWPAGNAERWYHPTSVLFADASEATPKVLINVFAVAHLGNKHKKPVIFDLIDNTAISRSDAIDLLIGM